MYGYSNEESEIVWITNLNQLEDVYDFQQGHKPFIFSRYQVVDNTCEKILKKKFLSMKRAEAKKEKQLSYKKHAKCSVDIVEDKLIDKVDIDFSNVLGTESNARRWETNFYRFQSEQLDDGKFTRPTLNSLITVKDNISLIATVEEVEFDKNLITKQEKQMRLTKLMLKDKNGNMASVTLFDSDMADNVQVGTKLQLVDAQVNMRMPQNSNSDPLPDGLKIPPWGSISIFSTKPELEKVN